MKNGRLERLMSAIAGVALIASAPAALAQRAASHDDTGPNRGADPNSLRVAGLHGVDQKLCPVNPPVVAESEVWLRDVIPVILAGSQAGVPSDSPTNRIDPNTPGSPYAGTAHLTLGGISACTGVAISRRHILSAGHCVDLNDNGTNDVGTNVVIRFNINGSSSTIIGSSAVASVTVHPDYTGFLNPTVNDDLIIITLNQDIPAAIPVTPVYTGVVTQGDEITMVGYGRTGFGDVGATINGNSTTKRVGWNRAEQFFADEEGSGVLELFQYDFDGPTLGTNCFGGTTLGNDIESVVAQGDSGGPAFIEADGRMYVWGVNTFGGSCVGPFSVFGSIGGGILVNGYLPWFGQFVPPNPFALASPADGALGVGVEPSLDWEPAGFTQTYSVAVATDPNMLDEVFTQTGLAPVLTEFLLPPGTLEPNTTYYWTVTATNSNGATTPDAGPFAFTTKIPADITGDGAVNGTDLLALLNAWGSAEAAADLNSDGVVNGADLLILLNSWTG